MSALDLTTECGRRGTPLPSGNLWCAEHHCTERSMATALKMRRTA